MARIIELPVRRPQTKAGIIASRPLEFRKACKPSIHFIQIPRGRESEFEAHFRDSSGGVLQTGIPWGWELSRGQDRTICSLFLHRESENTMRRVYYLAGLVDCMINQVNPLLRTDLLRSLYKEAFELKRSLDVDWSGRLDEVLLPIEPLYYNRHEYQKALIDAETMKQLYRAIRDGTSKMFDVLSEQYVFYCPGAGGNEWKTRK
ncbi:MAG TPA: hypothetical protein ENN79_12250 [Desulfobacteraceae bacterium]|nr:hypothetical protein [Desulfobacteraceae bacterium]